MNINRSDKPTCWPLAFQSLRISYNSCDSTSEGGTDPSQTSRCWKKEFVRTRSVAGPAVCPIACEAASSSSAAKQPVNGETQRRRGKRKFVFTGSDIFGDL